MNYLTAFLTLLTAAAASAELKVASLHPLMADLTRQVGGERVTVLDVGKVGMNVHTFEPTAKDLQAMSDCHLVVASGKGIETYLSSLTDALGQIPILQVGDSVPSLTIAEGDLVHACCDHGQHDHDEHADGAIDPHWWHDVSNMERAAKGLAKQLVKMDPEGKDYYESRSKETRKRLQDLERWVKAEMASIPTNQRKLVTAHAAFGYFCKAYNLTPVFVLGLSGDHEVPAKRLAEEVAKLQSEQIRAAFPEKIHNPKILAQVAKQAGVKMGGTLVADGAVTSYEEMVRGNVTTIVKGLANSE